MNNILEMPLSYPDITIPTIIYEWFFMGIIDGKMVVEQSIFY